MKKLLGRGLVLGALAGTAAVLVQAYLKNSGEGAGEETVQLVFDDGSTHALNSGGVEGQEFTDMARKILEIGL